MDRRILWSVLVIGVALIVAPLVLQMPTRATAGQRMMNDFRPIMQADNVAVTARYYNDVFVPLGKVAPIMGPATVAKFDRYLKGFAAVQTDAQKLVPALAAAMHMTPAQVQAMLRENYPAFTQMLASMPQMQRDFGGLLGAMRANTDIFAQVPAGLRHYKPLVVTMQGNVGDYENVDSLPDFGLFTWFFVIPGALLVALASWGLFLPGRTAPVKTGRAHPTPA